MRNFSRIVGALSSAGLLGATFTLAAGSGAVASTAPAIVHAPRIPVTGHGMKNTWQASNWSGYAETGSGYTGVSGTWTVPTVTASPVSSTSYSATWIGVDGFNNNSLIQTGTEQDFSNGTAHYGAWWEILPAAETVLPSGHPVYPGDKMTASIYQTSATSGGITRGRYRFGSQHVWSISISDTTPGHVWNYSINENYNGAGTSAEWVMEAPQVGGQIAALADYSYTKYPPSPSGSGDFDNAEVQIHGTGSPSYTPAGLNYANDSGVMIQNNAQVSTPGYPNTTNPAGTAFNVAYGSAVPSTPSS